MIRKSRKAYSLLELSIVIVIISILITGAMTVSVGNINNAKIKVTKDRLKVIHNALGAFVSANGRLPCPASLVVAKGNANYGVMDSTAGTCTNGATAGVYLSNSSANLVYGMLPVTTLGLAKEMAEDGWEDKIAYVVDKNFTYSAVLTSPPDFSLANFSTYTVGNVSNNIIAYQKSGSSTINLMTNAVYALVSHGPNKKGAFGAVSTSQNVAPTDADELSNYIAVGATPNFDNAFTVVSENSDSFDDIVEFTNPQMMVATFNLYRLLPCNRLVYSSGYGTGPVVAPASLTVPSGTYHTVIDPNYPNTNAGGNAWFGQLISGTSCTSPDYGKSYTKKCGAMGTWVVQSSCSSLP